MKVYERLAEAFIAEGTRAVFGMIGDGNMHWIHALDDSGVKTIEVRHEGAGLTMADGWARATHDVGVATATCGPGVTQLATALVVASRARSPLVAFVGETPAADDEHIQSFDQSKFAAACETAFVRLSAPELVDDAVRKAFYLARTESRPVMLTCPNDIQAMTFDDDDPYRPTSAFLPPLPLAPSSEALARAVEMITAAEKPVIIVGRGALWAGAGDAVRAMAQRIGALVSTTMQVKTWLADDEFHAGIAGLYSTRNVMKLFQQADVVIGVGASMNRYTIEGGYLFPAAKYVHLDTRPHALMGGGAVADLYVNADAKLGVEVIDAELARVQYHNSGFRTPDVAKLLAVQYEDSEPIEVDPGMLDPREIIAVLDELIPLDTVVQTSSGACGGFAIGLLNRPRLVLGAYWFGCIGQSLPSAIGAAEALKRPVLVIEGDGSAMMNFMELSTAVRENLPLLLVVLNDQALGSEYHKLKSEGLRPEIAAVATPDLGSVMRAFGGKGTLVETIDQLQQAVSEWVSAPSPTVIDARISRNVLTIQFRRMYQGQDV